MADLPWQARSAYISPMSPGNDNHVDWTAAATPQDERVADRMGERMLASLTPPRARSVPQTRRSVMDTLLGQNDLSALDATGGDPYNATGRQFRR